MLRILTYNVHRWVGIDRKISPGRVAEVIASTQAEVVALQEVRAGRSGSGELDQAVSVARYLGMELHFQPTIRIFGEQFGLAVMTALPSRVVKSGRLPTVASGHAIEKRSALWVAIDCGGTELQVVNAHLSLRSRERLAQAEALLGEDWLGHQDCHGPAVLLGDFNAPPRSRAYKLLASHLADVQLATGLPQARPTFHTRMPLMRLDHIFVRGSVDVLSAAPIRTALARVASDHLPLAADLKLGTAAEAQKRVGVAA